MSLTLAIQPFLNAYKRNIILNSVRQDNHFITRDNNMAGLIITLSNKVVVLTYNF